MGSSGEVEALQRQVEQLTQAFSHNFSVYSDILSQMEMRQACLFRLVTELSTGKVSRLADNTIQLEEYAKDYYATLGLAEFLKAARTFEEEQAAEIAPLDDVIEFGGVA